MIFRFSLIVCLAAPIVSVASISEGEEWSRFRGPNGSGIAETDTTIPATWTEADLNWKAPLPGPGAAWFEIDVLGFDQQFLSVLSLIASLLTLIGMVVLRPMMAQRSIAYVIVILTIAAAILSLPNIGLYYGLHEWTAARTGGIVDARFIALIDTMIESPLGQISMIPMLAWIAKNAPVHLKATLFAVMASFTNLALSAASLGTKYLNEIYTVTREVRDRVEDVVKTAADYSELGWLLITVALIGLLAPLLTVVLVQHSRLHTQQ